MSAAEQLTLIDVDLSRVPSSSSDRDALSRLPAAQLLRGGMSVELVPYAAWLVVELGQIAIERRELERGGAA